MNNNNRYIAKKKNNGARKKENVQARARNAERQITRNAYDGDSHVKINEAYKRKGTCNTKILSQSSRIYYCPTEKGR